MVVVTHDLESLKRISDRVAFLGEGKVIDIAPIDVLMRNPHPLIVDYFSNQ